MSELILPRVIGHRGAAASAPENTLAGFRHAARLGVGWVELDVQLTADGVPVVFHDDGLERTTNGQGRLIETSLAALRRLDAGAWFDPAFAGEPVPTLAEAIETLVSLGLGLNIEIKANESRGELTAQDGLAIARRLWPADRPPPLLSSFARSALAAAAIAAPDWPRALLVERVPADVVDQARRLGCEAVNADQQHLTAAVVDEIKAAGLKVLAYTVNQPERAVALWAMGVDGLFSDCPELLAGCA